MKITILSLLLTASLYGYVCEICQKEKQKSKVTPVGCDTTLMASGVYFDEEGKQHFHDPNIVKCAYQCDRGHRFEKKYKTVEVK